MAPVIKSVEVMRDQSILRKQAEAVYSRIEDGEDPTEAMTAQAKQANLNADNNERNDG